MKINYKIMNFEQLDKIEWVERQMFYQGLISKTEFVSGNFDIMKYIGWLVFPDRLVMKLDEIEV